MSEDKNKNKDKKNFRVGLIAILAIVAVIVLWTSFSGGGSVSKGPGKIEAYSVSQEFVQERLKTPSTAKFPVFKDDMVVHLNNNRFKVSSYVDAQNSFGAVVRTLYTCWIKNVGGNEWELENIELNE